MLFMVPLSHSGARSMAQTLRLPFEYYYYYYVYTYMVYIYAGAHKGRSVQLSTKGRTAFESEQLEHLPYMDLYSSGA